MAETKEKDASGKINIDAERDYVNSLTFDDRVIKKIAGMAASEVPGILAMSNNFISGITDKLRNSDDPTRGITVEVGKKQVAIDMKIVCEYGKNIPEIFQTIIDRVTDMIKEMTGLDVVEVNVHVYDVLTKEDFDRQSRKKMDDRDKPSEDETRTGRLD